MNIKCLLFSHKWKNCISMFSFEEASLSQYGIKLGGKIKTSEQMCLRCGERKYDFKTN